MSKPSIVKSKPVSRKTNALSELVRVENASRAKQLKKEKQYKNIAILRQKNIVGSEVVTVLIASSEVREWLGCNAGLEECYDKVPKFSPNDLIPSMDKIKDGIANGLEFLCELDQFLDHQLGDTIFACKELVSKEVISYDKLWYIMPKGTEVVTVDDNEISAGTVISIQYHSGWGGQFFSLVVDQISSNGQTFFSQKKKFIIRAFNGTLKISELSVRPLESDLKNKLIERGKVYEKYGINTHYLQYSGNLKLDTWMGPKFYRSEGRILIDPVSFEKRDDSGCRRTQEFDAGATFTTIPEKLLAFHEPYMKGFSFSLKKWGTFAVSQMADIKFNDNAFDTLVLDQKKKDVISALVKNSTVGFKDIIQGKSGGIIFLCDGKPGTGKTLTAEAIAEMMHRPLYSVSVGELGVSPNELEEKLREILEIASTWNAVVLIDEADIFLEKRNESDIVRNAMVGIFLRLLEYHQGVLFLTTNRVKNFDEAFHSRISVSLHYEPHGKDGMRKIWTNLLKVAGITHLNIDDLLEFKINGRQIKTSIRLAQALAADKKEMLTTEHIKLTISLQYNGNKSK